MEKKRVSLITAIAGKDGKMYKLGTDGNLYLKDENGKIILVENKGKVSKKIIDEYLEKLSKPGYSDYIPSKEKLDTSKIINVPHPPKFSKNKDNCEQER